MRLHSYIVRYDSGFAPNPFFGFCTLATCKPGVRQSARLGEWVIGTGSANRKYRRGGYLVYAMRVAGALPFPNYWSDPRFQDKKPDLGRSRMHACGDNIYRFANGRWHQLNSFHSNSDGSPSAAHIARDTSVNRVLFGNEFTYFGGEGPKIPREFRRGKDICVSGIGRKIFDDEAFIADFADWLNGLRALGYCGKPMDWIRDEWR